MKKILVVVDMQRDFVDGALGTSEAVTIVPNVVNKIRSYDGVVVATRDTHEENYLSTQEGQKLPIIHCIKGTPGWEIIPEVASALEEKKAVIFDKPTFGSIDLAEYLREFAGDASIEIIGLCTDICVVSNALLCKAYMPDARISVDASCCAGVTPDAHKAALATMQSCQIDIKNCTF